MALLELTESEINALIDPILKEIPNQYHILMEATKNISEKKLEKRYIKMHFSEIVNLVARETYSKYKVYQKKASKPLIQSFIKKYINEIETNKVESKQLIIDILEAFIPLAIRFELRLSQMRKSRAGSTFEQIIAYLLKMVDIKCEITSKGNRIKLNRMDIVLPDQNTAIKKPDKAIFLSCKHTLRERWKQSIPEQNRGWKMYLLTLEDDIPNEKAREIHGHGLIIFVKDEVKAKPHLARKDWIRKLSDLPSDLLLPY